MTSEDHRTPNLTLVRTIRAPREQVFDAWLDPEVLPHFMKPAPGATVPRVEVEAREGGEFLVLMRVGDREIPHRGRYREIRRPERLVFTWISDGAGEASFVVLELEALSSGSTRLSLRHELLPSEKARSDHHQGWTAIFSALDDCLAQSSD